MNANDVNVNNDRERDEERQRLHIIYYFIKGSVSFSIPVFGPGFDLGP